MFIWDEESEIEPTLFQRLVGVAIFAAIVFTFWLLLFGWLAEAQRPEQLRCRLVDDSIVLIDIPPGHHGMTWALSVCMQDYGGRPAGIER